MEGTKKDLISAIDDDASKPAIIAKDLLDKYREWQEESPKAQQDETVLKSLREKELWTFEEADNVRELCRRQRERGSAFDIPDRTAEMFDALTTAMTLAAKQHNAENAWKSYNASKDWLQRGSGFPKGSQQSLKDIRQAFGRQHPAATVRELVRPYQMSFRYTVELGPLKTYGYDSAFVDRQLKTAWKLIAHEIRERRLDEEMFSAARRFFALEEAQDERGAWKGAGD